MRALVVGSGFGGMYISFLLARDYGYATRLVDPSPVFGGVMSGRRHNSFSLDYGCQVFDNFDPDVTRYIQELGNHCCVGKTISYASRFQGTTSMDIGVPNLSQIAQPEKDRILEEVKAAAKKDERLEATDTLHDYFEKSWGQTAASHLEPACSKFFNMPSTELDQATRVYMGLSRVVVADAKISLALKAQCDAMDNRIAVARSARDSFYPAAMAELPYPNLHPMPHSFMSYCEQARGVLEQNGIEISLKTRIEHLVQRGHQFEVGLLDSANDSSTTEVYDLVVWTGKLNRLEQLLFKTDSLSQYIKPMSMHLFYHFADASQFSQTGYFQNYDHDIDVFRWSSLGVYSDQIDADGVSFCCTEIPDHEGIVTGESHAPRHWHELRELELVEGDFAGDPVYIHAPNCFDRFLKNFGEASEAVMEQIDTNLGNFVYAKPTEFGRINAALGLHERVRALH